MPLLQKPQSSVVLQHIKASPSNAVILTHYSGTDTNGSDGPASGFLLFSICNGVCFASFSFDKGSCHQKSAMSLQFIYLLHEKVLQRDLPVSFLYILYIDFYP